MEDYHRLTDLASGLGIRGVIFWGSLRDGHGGIDSARRVADYAASQNVVVMPGIGTNHYGGVYHEGDHPYSIETLMAEHPDVGSVDECGPTRPRSICPLHPRFVEWLSEGMQWLFREFGIGGANLENGDFLVCHSRRCRENRAAGFGDEPDFWRHQQLGYGPALQAIEDQLRDSLVTWASYSGFIPGRAAPGAELGSEEGHGYMECERPALVDSLPPDSICQWTLTGMVRAPALPLTAYLEDGAPAAALSADTWPAPVKPPTKHSVGFLHQGSQWGDPPRYEQVVSTIKEACLRAYRAGLEGVGIHGEVSSMHVPWALNHLAFSHFVHWPEDSLREFGRKTLGQALGSEDEGEAFAELLAHWDAGSLSDVQKKDLLGRSLGLRGDVAGTGDNLVRWRFWSWLHAMATGAREAHTASLY